MTDRYAADPLAGDWRAAGRVVIPTVPVEPGLVVERADGFVGAVVAIEKGNVGLEDRQGKVRWFPLGSGYLIDGSAITLTAPVAPQKAAARTASGSRAAESTRARVARASRILVEGRHDAELVERVWGADLRDVGVVVEYLEGVDHLPSTLAEFRPGPARRIGVLVDHLVPGSKESRIAASASSVNVLIVGHPFVDIWQAVRPERLGLRRWPDVPRGTDIKHGTCAALGWPHADQADIARAWKRILGTVRDYTDLDPTLTGRVEELIDFVTEDPSPHPD